MSWNKKKFTLNIYWISQRLLCLGIVLSLLSSCTSVSNNSLPATGTPTPVQLTFSTPTQPTVPAPSVTATQQTDSRPSATPKEIFVQPQSVAPTIGITPIATESTNQANIKTVFIIVMENHNWSDILNNPSAPYINDTLLPQASYAQQYYNPSRVHPSEPNYLWLEAGTSFGITSDDTPQTNHQSTTDHLVTYLDNAGITWKAYQEDISGTVCPLQRSGLYSPKHNPMVFFNDVTGNNNPNSAYCIAHERPYTELQSDLQNNSVAQYNFITPNLCDNMHDSEGCQTQDEVKNGDTWLSEQVPMIMGSNAYQQGGVIFITWDESENGDHPIGMIVLSPFARGGGYSNSIHYTHSSTLRTIEEIFNLTPLLGDASKATDLRDLFRIFP